MSKNLQIATLYFGPC